MVFIGYKIYVMTIIFNQHLASLLHINHHHQRAFINHITGNFNVYNSIRVRINDNFASISVSLYLIIATLFDGIARCRDRRNVILCRLLCLRAHAAFRCGVPLQRERAHRQGGCHHARRKRCTDEPHTLFTHSPRSFVF